MNLTSKKRPKKMVSSTINLSMKIAIKYRYGINGILLSTKFMCISKRMQSAYLKKQIKCARKSKTFQDGESKAKKITSFN